MLTLIRNVAIASLLTSAVGQISQAADSLPNGLYARFDTTMGEFVVELEYQKAPLTVANFVGLAEGTRNSNKPAGTPFYDGLIFHRVIDNFMIQGGDPEGTGRGGPGYRFPDEFHPDLKHSGPGILSMANSGPNSNGSQFFITTVATPWLDNKHSVFGRVVQGQDVVAAIGKVPKGSNDRPAKDVMIKSVKIERVGDDAKSFKGDQAHFDQLLASIAKQQQDANQERLQRDQRLVSELIETTKKENPGVDLVTTDSGLQFFVLKTGEGASPKQGDTIRAHYVGKFPNGKVFDSSVARNQPISFPIGVGRVIKGWDEALMSMKPGEKRLLIIPPDLGYGSRGAGGGVIPPNATLIFEVELIEVL